jgi:hypothetical protein
VVDIGDFIYGFPAHILYLVVPLPGVFCFDGKCNSIVFSQFHEYCKIHENFILFSPQHETNIKDGS